MNYMDKVREIRANTAVHFNCCQSILAVFAQDMGVSEEQAYALGAHFGGGMRQGATCGVLTGAMMVLGAAGIEDKQAAALMRQFQQEHGATDCIALLQASHGRGVPKKDHCDGLVFETVAYLEQILHPA